MSTKIFASYSEFLRREDKKGNGVDADHVSDYPEFEKENETNEGCWNCSRCSDCFRCSDCSGCSRCSRCSCCSGCSGCSHIAFKVAAKGEAPSATGTSVPGFPPIPVVDNIHQKVFEAASQPKALAMDAWHTCDTTHCRAGWVVFLAGPDGHALEKATSTQFAAMQIYKVSSPLRVSPPRFFESKSVALADMKRMAEEEVATIKD